MISANSDSFINIHTHFKPHEENEFVVRNAYHKLDITRLQQLPYAVSCGLHPWHLSLRSIKEIQTYLQQACVLSNVIAIGEIGIDRAINVPISRQLDYFEAQLEIAVQHSKPVIIHAVRSYSDLMPYVKKQNALFIIHQFSGNELQAKELADAGAMLSFGKNLFIQKHADVFKQIPVSSLLLETDQSPVYTIRQVYAKAAEIKEIALPDLKSDLFHTFARISGM